MIHGRKRSSQHGFAMLEIFMALAIGMAALAAFAMYQAHWNATREAQAAGRDWSQIGSAMRSWVGLNAGRLATSGAQTITHNNLNFLRNQSCGGTANLGEDFLPCNVANYGNDGSGSVRSSFYEDPTIETVINVTPPAGNDVARIDVTMTQVISKALTQGTAGKVAAIVAQSARQDILGPNDPTTGLPMAGSFISFWANAPVNVADPLDPKPTFGVDTGRVVMAINNAPTNDAWLRVDGTNMMLANLNMGNGSHDLVNARNIEANGLGIFGEGVIADGDILTTKNLYVGGADAADGDTIGLILGDDVVINDIKVGGANPRASNGVYDVRIVPTGTFIDKPECSVNTTPPQTPQIFAFPVSYASEDIAQAIHSVITYATPDWVVKMDILTSDGWKLSDDLVDKNLRLISVIVKCS